ncbi:MAG: hypothetical protein GY841_04455 [FCB group bacterium]|nr:hypothetical protein [FCB group bacterium]
MISLTQLKNQSELIKDRDWQTLIILDACRFDTFASVIKDHAITGDLIEVDSSVCKTSGWYKHNWRGRHDDVVLVTGHPMVWRNDRHKTFHFAINILGSATDWCVPSRTLEKAVEAQEKYPDKKIMAHLIPPHLPFMGEQGKLLHDDIIQMSKKKPVTSTAGGTLYQAATKYGLKFGWDKLIACYRENLEYALAEILLYIDKLKDPIIITADHGELLGNNKKKGPTYGHKGGHDVLRRVPWFAVKRKADDKNLAKD